MSIGKRCVLFLLTVFVCSNAIAQYTEDDGGIESPNGYLRYVGLGAGATYQVMSDEAISPVIYSKISALPMANLIKVSQTTYTDVSIRASQVNLTHNMDRDMKVNVKTQRALVDYRFMFKMPVESRYNDIRAGGILSGSFTNKLAPHLKDASKVYEYAASLGICGKITREFVLGDNTTFLTWDVSIPLVANISRPFYLNRENLEDPDAKVISDFIGNSSTGSFGTFFRLNSRAALMYRLENGNIIQLAYEWDYTRMKTINKAYFVEHILSVIFMFNY